MTISIWNNLRGSYTTPMEFDSWISSFEHELDCIHSESGADLEPEFDRNIADKQQYSEYLSCFDASYVSSPGPIYPVNKSFFNLTSDLQIEGDLKGLETDNSERMFACKGVLDKAYLPIDASFMMVTDSEMIFSDVKRLHIFHYSLIDTGYSFTSYRAYKGTDLKLKMNELLTPILVSDVRRLQEVANGKMILKG